MQEVVIVHELDQSANRELVEQLVGGSVPDGGADGLGGFVNVMIENVKDNVDVPVGSRSRTVPSSPLFAGTLQ